MPSEEAFLLGDAYPAQPGAKARSASPVTPDTELQGVAKIIRDRLRARRYLRLLAVLSDMLALAMSFFGAGLFRFGDPLHGSALSMLAVIAPAYFLVALNHRAFHLAATARARTGAWNAFSAFLISLSIVALAVFFLKVGEDFSRFVFGLGALLALVLLPSFRLAFGKIGRSVFGEVLAIEILIEDGVRAPHSEAIVLNSQWLNLSPRLDDPAMLDRLGRYLQGSDRVVVACEPERRSLWAIALKGADVNAEVTAAELDSLGALGLSNFNGRSTLRVASSPLLGIDRALKRSFDLGLTIVALPFALPIMALAAIAVRAETRGPILFSQQRVGLGNRIFKIYKLRSMYSECDDLLGERSTARSDERVTRVGRFIRATSIDELPQLFNVLLGSMSIVGPRPHALQCKADDRLFWDIDLRYWHRHAVKPGLTGLAQVRGFRGTTEQESQFTDRLQADLEYLAGWSIWRDIGILFATFRVLIHKNAF